MPRELFTTSEILFILAETPPGIASLTEGVAAESLLEAPCQDEWSANEVLAHLRSCADVWGECMAHIIAENHPTIRAIDPRTWIKRTDYPIISFADSLAAFTSQRTELLARLGRLEAMDWFRSATVIGAGAPLERTLQGYGSRLARHERSHLKQIARTLKAVGANRASSGR